MPLQCHMLLISRQWRHTTRMVRYPQFSVHGCLTRHFAFYGLPISESRASWVNQDLCAIPCKMIFTLYKIAFTKLPFFAELRAAIHGSARIYGLARESLL